MELIEIQFYVLDRNYESRIKLTLFRLLAVFILLINSYIVSGQVEKGSNIFGIQVKAIIPSSILNSGEQIVKNDSIAFTVGGARGFTIGGMIRHNFTKAFTLEAGIHLVSRTYSFNFNHNIQNIDDIQA